MATAPSRTDAVLVRRLRERDRTAWGEVYSAYGPRLRAYAFRLSGNAHDADDLVQETFVRALPRLDRLDPATVELGPYLFTALRNTFLKQVERTRRAMPVEEVPEPDVPLAIEDDPERGTLLRSQQDEVRRANANLAPRQRLVLAMRELEDKSYAEIGVVVGLNENAVAQLISRARESLRTELRLAQVSPDRLPEECRAFLPLLSRHLDGALRGEQLERTLAHLEGCERCQDSLASMRDASRRYRSLFPLLVGGEDAHAAAIDAELEAAGYWRPPRAVGRLPRAPKAAVLAVAAVALLALSGAGTAVLVTRDGSPPTVAAPAESTTGSTSTPAPPLTTAPATAAPPTTAPATTVAPKPKPATAPRTRTRPGQRAAAAATEAATTDAATTDRGPPPTAPTTTRAASTVAVVETLRPPAMTAPPETATAAPPATRVPGAPTSTAPRLTPPARPPATTTTRTPTAPADTTAPTVSFTEQPPASTRDTNATFAFHANESGATLECRLDAAPFAACGSPTRYQELLSGPHVLSVRARDRAGNTGPAVSARWEVVAPDTTPPTVSISSVTTDGGSASFGFAASERDVAFSCALDGGAPEACTSPKAYAGLAPGTHTFAVRATDAAGNTSAPAGHSWSIAAPLPNLVITALGRNGFTVANVGTAPAGAFVVSVTQIGAYTFGGLAPGQSQTRTWSICRTGTLTAIADRDGMVAESNEADNARSVTSTC